MGKREKSRNCRTSSLSFFLNFVVSFTKTMTNEFLFEVKFGNEQNELPMKVIGKLKTWMIQLHFKMLDC